MARKEKYFEVSPFAAEGGRRDTSVSLNDPLLDQDDVYGNRLKFINYQSPYPGNLQQDYLQRLQNDTRHIGIISPSIDTSPSTSPFPLGCPTGFFQQGNVCIPYVGTYPRDDDFAPPGGQNYAKGIIQQVIAPSTTTKGQNFTIQCYFQNIGAIQGKFSLKVTIPDINITDQPTTGVWVPQFSNGVLYKQVLMPSTVTSTATAFNATLSLLKLDEVSRELVVDDSETFVIPAPTTGGTTNPPPITTQECYLVNNINYCRTTTPGIGCFTFNGAIYCPPQTPTPPPTGDPDPAVILLSPSGSIHDGNTITVKGTHYKPLEIVDVKFRGVGHGKPGYEGKVYTINKTEPAGSTGIFTETIKTPEIPSGVTIESVITCVGRTSLKSATQTISVI